MGCCSPVVHWIALCPNQLKTDWPGKPKKTLKSPRVYRRDLAQHWTSLQEREPEDCDHFLGPGHNQHLNTIASISSWLGRVGSGDRHEAGRHLPVSCNPGSCNTLQHVRIMPVSIQKTRLVSEDALWLQFLVICNSCKFFSWCQYNLCSCRLLSSPCLPLLG